MNEIEIQNKIGILLKVGKMLLESSADTARILRTMYRCASYLGLNEKELHIYIHFNMIMVNFITHEKSFTRFERCEKHGVNMTTITLLSRLTITAKRNSIPIEQFEEELEQIKNKKRHYSSRQVAIGAGFACGGFAIQFGCDWIAFLYTSIAAMAGFKFREFLNRKGLNSYLNIALASLFSTLLAFFSTFVPSLIASSTPWHPLMACSLFIVPGVPLINFVNDILEGHTEVGITRAANTLIILFAMATGISIATKICGIDNFARNLNMIPHNNYFSYAIAAAVSAVGFSLIFNIPKKILGVVAIGGMISVCIRNFVNLGPSSFNVGLDLGLVMGSLVGASVISIIATRLVNVLHVPHHCISIPSVIPMIPGVLMYRSLFAFNEMHGIVGEVTVAMHNGILASLTILCISFGVAIPNVFIKRMLKPSKKY